MTKNNTSFHLVSGPLTNKCLIAAPNIGDERFDGSVIYICSHSDKEGTKGLVLNKSCSVNFEEVLSELNISSQIPKDKYPKVLWGGPVDQIRGFILHSNDFSGFETTAITDQLNMTVSIDVLSEIAKGAGPKERLLMLGYSAWQAGQLELEIAGNMWFVVDVDTNFLFHCPSNEKWKTALSMIGIDPLLLSLEQGSV